MVEKFLNNNERIIYSTDRPVSVGKEGGFTAHVTNQRVIFHNRRGMLFKKDRLIDVLHKHISGINFSEEGLLFKKKLLTIRGTNTEINLQGKSSELEELHRQINNQLLEVPRV